MLERRFVYCCFCTVIEIYADYALLLVATLQSEVNQVTCPTSLYSDGIRSA